MANGHNIGKYLGQIQRLQLKYFKSFFDRYHLPPSCFLFIINIAKQPGISQKQLSNLTHVDEALATRMVQQMEKKKIVHKDRNPKDKRAFQLYLTDEGKALLPSINNALDQWWECLLDNIDIDVLEHSLQMMTEHAKQKVYQGGKENK